MKTAAEKPSANPTPQGAPQRQTAVIVPVGPPHVEAWPAHPIPMITFTVSIDGVSSDRIDIPMQIPLPRVWRIFDILTNSKPKSLTVDDAAELSIFGGTVLWHIEKKGAIQPEAIPEIVKGALASLAEMQSKTTPAKQIAEICYHWLRAKYRNRTEVAQYANYWLKPKQRYSVLAWQLQVDRWAAKRGLPKVEWRKRPDELSKT
ncbi:MAG TPA: hypothetical protein VLA19_22880 [Herpetosiphonaceae bacterium]|nr:hypothetical protein [Herpetosiphonaceae bacterium]